MKTFEIFESCQTIATHIKQNYNGFQDINF
jgi:hypothetical protein